MFDFYQNIPQYLNPIAFSIGFLNIRWYSLMYLVGLFVVISLLWWRNSKRETIVFQWDDILDFLLYSFFGILVGGRLGYVFFYDWSFYSHNLLKIISPFNSGKFIGLYGMSYYGALIGFACVAYFFCKSRKINFWEIIDFIVPAIPAGYFFGRLGNFLNGELYGRITDEWWGMHFNNEYFLRYPSQLLEAFFEGIFLFAILWILRNKFFKKKGFLTGLYLMLYGIIRFLLEFLRQPDEQLGFIIGFLTMGQILSLVAIFAGLIIILLAQKNVKRPFAK